MIRSEERPRLNLRVDFAHAREKSFHQLLRADRAVADQPCRFRRGKQVKISKIHRVGRWSIGVLECWGGDQYSTTPSLQLSILRRETLATTASCPARRT